MESLSSLTGDVLIHGLSPDASQTSPLVDTSTPQPLPEEIPKSRISRSSSLLNQEASSFSSRSSPAARAKRLTLSFPISVPSQSPATPATSSLGSPGPMTPGLHSARPSPGLPTGTPVPFDLEDDGYDFLRAIASQERRVLELREELQRAEVDLDTLKRQWAVSEQKKKRAEIRLHAEPMQPLRTSEPGEPGASAAASGSGAHSHRRDQSINSVGSQERVSRELDRRSAWRTGPTPGTTISSNGRRVFTGSHTRTLSLLSPATPTINTGHGLHHGDHHFGRTPRSATLPSVERKTTNHMPISIDEGEVPEHLLTQWRKTMPPPSRDALMRTGKQMASDFREGLWTFLEDIRQATVGEEGINATESRTSPSNSLAPPPHQRKRDSLVSRSRERLSVVGSSNSRSSSSSSRGRALAESKSGKETEAAIDASFWHEFGVDSPAQKPLDARRSSGSPSNSTTPQGTKERKNPDHHSEPSANTEDDDNWDLWDTPLPVPTKHTPSSSRSTFESSKPDQSPTTQGSSPRTSASFGDWNPLSSVPDPNVTEGIPWPIITKLAPSKLQRTASNLMAEWERSLSPSPERSSLGKSNKKD